MLWGLNEIMLKDFANCTCSVNKILIVTIILPWKFVLQRHEYLDGRVREMDNNYKNSSNLVYYNMNLEDNNFS